MAIPKYTPDFTPEELETEEWRPVPDFLGYEVSNLGRVRSWKRPAIVKYCDAQIPHIIKPSPKMQSDYPDRIAYMRVTLCSLGTRINIPVHRLVLTIFVSPCPDGLEGCHWDGNPENNRLSNLRWDTKASNSADSVRHGTKPIGEKSPNAILVEKQVIEIRQRYALGESLSNLSVAYGVNMRTIACITTGESWRHVDGITHVPGEHYGKRPLRGADNPIAKRPELEQGENNGHAKLTTGQVIEIRKRYSSGETAVELSTDYNISPKTIWNIVAGRLWKTVSGPITHRRKRIIGG